MSAFHFNKPNLWGTQSLVKENQIHNDDDEGGVAGCIFECLLCLRHSVMHSM